MTRLYARHLGCAVGLLALLVPHWIPALRSADDTPVSFLVGLSVAGVATLGFAVLRNRAACG